MNPKIISQNFNLSDITAKLLYSRGFRNKNSINNFINPSLSHFNSSKNIPGINSIKETIQEHIDWKSKIFIVGDFDCDGVCSSAILHKTLNRMGAFNEVIIGDRFKDGYGLSKRIINKISKNNGNLIITVDLGINNKKEIEYAKKKGIDVIVIDHHLSDNPPDCLFADLKVKKGKYPFEYFSAAGLTWKICQYLLNDNLYDLLDIVTMSTVADLVPLKNENRVITKFGLEKLTNSPNLGLKELKVLKGLNKKKINTGHIGYILGAIINAQGRLYNNQKSFELLTTNNREKAKKIAAELDKTNQERKRISNKCLKKAKEKINKEDNVIILKHDIPPGIVGLVAGDIKEELGKPTIIFGQPDKNGICKGSGRSISPLNLKKDILDNTRYLLESGGGHAKAAGFSVKNKNFDKFKNRSLQITKNIKYKTIQYDMSLDVSQINYNLIKELKIFEPTGMGNPSPKFLIHDRVTNISPTKNGEHLLFKMGNISCIAFQMADKINQLRSNEKIIGNLDINKYRGSTSIQVKIKKIL